MALSGAHVFMSVVGVCMLGAGLIFHGAGLGTPEWDVIYSSLYLKEKPEKAVTAGLWKKCEKRFCKPIKETGSRISAAWTACEASSVIAMLMAAVSFTCGFCSICLTITNKKLPGVSLVCALEAAVAVFIAVSVWHAYIHDYIVSEWSNQAELGYSFFLSLIGGVLIAFGGIFVFAGSRRTPEQPYIQYIYFNWTPEQPYIRKYKLEQDLHSDILT